MRKEVEDCFAEGKLRKGAVDQDKIDGSLELSGKFLSKAKKVLPTGLFDIAFLTAYNSMFHSARALLFKSGVKEQSHFCMVAYLREVYEDDSALLEYLNAMDSYRITRNKIQYFGAECTEIDAKEAISDAEGLLRAAQDRVKNNPVPGKQVKFAEAGKPVD